MPACHVIVGLCLHSTSCRKEAYIFFLISEIYLSMYTPSLSAPCCCSLAFVPYLVLRRVLKVTCLHSKQMFKVFLSRMGTLLLNCCVALKNIASGDRITISIIASSSQSVFRKSFEAGKYCCVQNASEWNKQSACKSTLKKNTKMSI